MDRVTAECARFLLSQLDLASCLDLRSMPGVAPELFALADIDKKIRPGDSKEDLTSNVANGDTDLDSEKNGRKRIDLMDKIDDFIESWPLYVYRCFYRYDGT